MSIRIAHASDTHNRPSIVREFAQTKADLLLLTGDIISNRGRVDSPIPENHRRIVPHLEVKYQQSWFRKQAKKWAKDIGSRPVVTVRGNHDFISPVRWLKHYGVMVHEITDENPCVDLFGLKFAGFRQVLWMNGEWCGEVHDLRPMIDRAFACDPDILAVHTPPAGILDIDEDGDSRGSTDLASVLFYRPHRVTHCFFGHAHPGGGQVVEQGGITFINGAGHLKVHTVG